MEPLPRLTPATIDVLRALSEAEGSLWGLQIVKGTGRPTGTVYPILDRLERLGWITSAWEDDASRQGARRRFVRLNDGARTAARESIETFELRRGTD